jgi:uncharacterized protein YbaA (DUF1428 family)
VFTAAAFTVSYSAKAVRHAGQNLAPIAVRVHQGSLNAFGQAIYVQPNRESGFGWKEFSWDAARDAIKTGNLSKR